MKNLSQKIISLFTLCAVLLLSFSSVSLAYSPSTVKASVSETENSYIISLYITKPTDILSIDATLLYCDTLTFDNISFEGTDTDKYFFDASSFDITNAEENIYFECFYTKDDGIFRFTGYFLNEYSSETDFYICDVILNKSENSAATELCELSYSLSSKNITATDKITVALEDKSSASGNSPEKSIQLGDSDLDGTVTSSDARFILRCSVGLEAMTLKLLPYCDFDRDGQISSADARLTLRTAVSLEKPVFNNFEITLLDGATCEEGGTYRFYCNLTQTVFTAEFKSGEHNFEEPACLLPAICTICSTERSPATGHDFSNSLHCSNCNIAKTKAEEFTEEISAYLSAVKQYDQLAANDAEKRNIASFIKNTETATTYLKQAINCCTETIGTSNIRSSLEKAYQIRYKSFIYCTNDDGKIACNDETLDYILKMVNVSEVYITKVTDAVIGNE